MWLSRPMPCPLMIKKNGRCHWWHSHHQSWRQQSDPTDGTDNLVINGCVNNWKAAQSDSKKKSWEIFKENGLFASACRQRLILWIMDMIWSSELWAFIISCLICWCLNIHLIQGRISFGNCSLYCHNSQVLFSTWLWHRLHFSEDNCDQQSGPIIFCFFFSLPCQCISWLTHNYACQCKNHLDVVEGVCLEDFETMEHVFSS